MTRLSNDRCGQVRKTARKPTIAIFDYVILPTSATGGCHLRILEELCDVYDFTVFATEFANPNPQRIEFVRVPVPTRPTIVLLVLFHLLAPLYYFWYRLTRWHRFDAVQRIETFISFGQIVYLHFCYRVYLARHWNESGQPGLRGWLLKLDHRFRATVLEPIFYRLAKHIVVVSDGAAKELAIEYPYLEHKIKVIPNAVDTVALRHPPSFDIAAFRRELNFSRGETVLVFIALGQFERKGLPLVLSAMKSLANPNVKLLLVGGSDHWIQFYRNMAESLGIAEQLACVGSQGNVRPYLWCADAFILPSLYETFSLVTHEAAAAGLPLIVSRMNGVEDFARDGSNCILVEPDAKSVQQGISRFLSLTEDARKSMGMKAQDDVQTRSVAAFRANWRAFYTAYFRDASPLTPVSGRGKNGSPRSVSETEDRSLQV